MYHTAFHPTIACLFHPHDEEHVVLNGLDAQRLVALFFGGWFFFNFPLLGLWDKDTVWLGVPLFPAALFALWLLLIVIAAWLMEQPGQSPQDD
jgi:hypothetical protein